jgi:methionine biosynthesis protein MetW
MRDSALKRFLVSGYFSAREVWAGLRGMAGVPPWSGVESDYDVYWRERPPGGVQPRYEIIAKSLEPGTTLLDVGCGDGALLAYVEQRRRIRGVGIDISAVAVEGARNRGVDARVSTLSELLQSVPPSRFDHVVMSEVLEHVPDPEAMVRQGWELARRCLWLTFPNIAYFPHRLRLFAGRFPVQWVVFPGEHLRFWSIPDFRDWLRQLGFSAPCIWPSNGLMIFELHRLWPNLLANQIVVRLERE